MAASTSSIIPFTAANMRWVNSSPQRQDKAKREAEFLDALVEITHNYIAESTKPITPLQNVIILILW